MLSVSCGSLSSSCVGEPVLQRERACLRDWFNILTVIVVLDLLNLGFLSNCLSHSHILVTGH